MNSVFKVEESFQNGIITKGQILPAVAFTAHALWDAVLI